MCTQKFSLLIVRSSILLYLLFRILPCLHLTNVKKFQYHKLVDQGENSAQSRGPANKLNFV